MDIKFWQSPRSGRNYVFRFIKEQPKKIAAKIMKRLALFKERRPEELIKAGFLKKLNGYDFYEIKVDYGRLRFRIFCEIINNIYYLLHAIQKKKQKTPLKDLKTANERRQELLYFKN